MKQLLAFLKGTLRGGMIFLSLSAPYWPKQAITSGQWTLPAVAKVE